MPGPERGLSGREVALTTIEVTESRRPPLAHRTPRRLAYPLAPAACPH